MRDLGQLSTLDSESLEIPDPLFPQDTFTAKEAESEVVEATQESMEQSEAMDKVTRDSDDTMDDDTTPPAAPTPKNAASVSNPATPGISQFNGRRSGPPGSIPNFPGATTHRDPPPFFNSPITSPPNQSPLSSPPSHPTGSLRLPRQPFSLPDGATSSVQSPWHQLAATSGAPTPSIDGPSSGPGRSSPHLGYPFEKLNIGGSWSGANLWGEQSAAPESRRRPSLDAVDPPSSPSQPPRRGSGGTGLNPEILAKYRMMAGKASATNVRGGDGDTPSNPSSTSTASKPPLPAALAKRRASLPKNVLGGLLSPPLATGSKAPSPLASLASSPSPGPGLQPLTINALKPLLNKDSTLILDLRPPSAYESSHLPSSHSIPVPSTLLRRPAFNISKLSQMLSPKGREALSHWKDKSDIVLVDSDTVTIGSNSILDGVAAKFDREGYQGRVWFVKGGYAAIVAGNIGVVIEEQSGEDGTPNQLAGLQVGRLGKLAFSQGSVGSNLQAEKRGSYPPPTPSGSLGDPFASIASTGSTSSTERGRASLQGLTTSSMRSHQSSSSGRSGSPSSPQAPSRVQPANPFFDNIRQNLELSHGGGHQRISLELPKEAAERADELPTWLAELARMSDEESAERLAEEFYRVERGEQKRLQAIMDWHSNTSGGVVHQIQDGQQEMDKKSLALLDSWASGEFSGSDYFPYSITAGVEQGSKNRYKNIWPYDFSRVRLETPLGDQGDYINASFVQPRGTNRRYIATQGPLDATYSDFWLLVWEQRVSVIIMLTKQYEGGTMKCGNYWQDEQYGPLRVELESQTGGEDVKPNDVSGFDFGTAPDKGCGSDSENIKRTFSITREDKPDEPPRRVVQVQCTAWPDFDVPDHPGILLNVMKDADEAYSQNEGPSEGDDRADQPPVLVHCSAGVGRTGTYIIVDAMVDALRRERQALQSRLQDRPGEIPTSPGRQPLLTSTLPHLSPSPAANSASGSRQDSAERESGSSGGGSPGGSGTGSGILSNQGSNSALSRSGFGSGDSGKSVSFLIPPGSSESVNLASDNALPSVFTKSPSPSAVRSDNGRTGEFVNVTRPEGQNPLDKAIPHLEKEAERMDVDADESTEDDKRQTLFDNLFTKHRGGEDSVSSVGDSDLEITRRPSLTTTSGWGSAEQVSQERLAKNELYRQIGMPAPITKSLERHRTPSPVTDTDGLSPVAVVLESMRMQRMSLVQSLRQYLFAHKAIVQSYLDMIDEDRRQGKDVGVGPRPGLVSASSHHTSASTDEEGPSKRRASPTELVPEGTKDAQGGASLAKRPSFKKMRQAGMEEMGVEDGKPESRARRGSKLNKE